MKRAARQSSIQMLFYMKCRSPELSNNIWHACIAQYRYIIYSWKAVELCFKKLKRMRCYRKCAFNGEFYGIFVLFLFSEVCVGPLYNTLLPPSLTDAAMSGFVLGFGSLGGLGWSVLMAFICSFILLIIQSGTVKHAFSSSNINAELPLENQHHNHVGHIQAGRKKWLK